MATLTWQEWFTDVEAWRKNIEKRLAVLEQRQGIDDIADGVQEGNRLLRELKELIGTRTYTPEDLAALQAIKAKSEALDPVK